MPDQADIRLAAVGNYVIFDIVSGKKLSKLEVIRKKLSL